MSNIPKDKKTALITGASSGIGAATALELAGRGMRVFLAARRRDKLAQVADTIRQKGGDAQIFQTDLSQEDECLRLSKQVQEATSSLDILINNAGFGWYGYYSDMPWETAHDMLKVNITAVAHLTRLFLPGMRAQKSGHIINVGSVSAEIPSQGIAIYSASKSFMDAFTTSLHRELRGSPVHVSVVRAGPVRSEFYRQAAERKSGLQMPAERFAVPAELVARRIWGLMRTPRRAIYVPRALFVTPWIELLFGWLEDRLGPLLLRRQLSTRK